MSHIRTIILTALAVVAIGAVWHAKTIAQENRTPGVVILFGRDKLDAAFNKALSNNGLELVWSRTSSKGTYDVAAHSRESVKSACPEDGCGHKDFTSVVYVVSGAATLVVGGKVKAGTADKFGGQYVQGGESHRLTQGDMMIMPPDTKHWYKDVQGQFRYLEIRVP